MPHGFDDKKFQAEIDRIVGTNRDGKSILRLVHAPSVMTWALGEMVPRYWIRRRRASAGGWEYEQPDRWVVERRIEKAAYWDAHEASRFQDIDGSGEKVDLGPPPEEYFVFDSLIATHDAHAAESGKPLCCERAWEGETTYVLNWRKELVPEQVGDRMKCWGQYRDPDETDLARIAEAAERMRDSPYFDPYAPLTPGQLAVLEVAANMDAERMAEEQRERARQRREEINREFNRLHGWRRTNTDAGKRSKYHFLG